MKIASDAHQSPRYGNWRRLSVAFLGFIVVAVIIFFVVNDQRVAGEMRVGHAPDQSHYESRVRVSSVASPRVMAAENLTLASDPTITAITDRLKEMESKRAGFCRKIEDDSRILYEYLIKRPDPEEIMELKELASGARGLTEDQNGERISWKLHILNEFIPSPKYEHLILTIKYNKSTGRGRYDVTGIPYGSLDMRDGVSPISRDGKLYPVASNVPIDFASNWRFDKLFADAAESE